MDLFACRICLTSDKFQLSSLFLSKEGQSFAEMVQFSSGIVISEHDSLPQNICSVCLHQITEACEIKEKCINTDKLLRQQLKSENEVEQPIKPENLDWNLQNCLEIDFKEDNKDNEYQKLEEFEHFNENSPLQSDESESDDESLRRNCIKVKSPEKLFECSSCEQTFYKRKTYKKHLKNHRESSKKKSHEASKSQKTGNKKPEEHDYKCFICSKRFDLITHKDEHVKRDHAGENKCTICNKKKQTAISLETHMKHHFHEYRFLCSMCGKSFRFQNLLQHHMQIEHYNSIRFICDHCTYETKFKINLERHQRTVHLKVKNYKCLQCTDHEYSTQVGLNLHLYRIHNVEPPVKCTDCDQGFTFESELRVHKKHCTGNKIRAKKCRPQDSPVDVLENDAGFRCKICNQIFVTRSKWSVHYHHKHKNSNICHVCNKQMASSTSLFKHVQVQHNNVRAFKCDLCDKTFGFKHSMVSHRNTHTGEKPFCCNFCSFRSGDRSTISKHKKKMHQDQHNNTNVELNESI